MLCGPAFLACGTTIGLGGPGRFIRIASVRHFGDVP